MPDLTLFRDLATLALALMAFTSALYVARNKAVIENYRLTLKSANARIDALEADKMALECRVAKLEGVQDGYELASELYMGAVARAGVCAVVDCPNRVLPEPAHRAGI